MLIFGTEKAYATCAPAHNNHYKIGGGDGQFNHTKGSAVGSTNNVYVVHPGNNRIQKL
jgi:hypothetical protein